MFFLAEKREQKSYKK